MLKLNGDKIIIFFVILLLLIVYLTEAIIQISINKKNFDKNMEFKIRVEKKVEEIKQDYPILRNERILVWFKRFEEFTGESRMYPFGRFMLYVDPRDYEGVNEILLIGGLAHEIAHLEQYKQVGYPGMITLGLKYVFSEKFRRKVETGADIIAITNGYGEELLERRKHRLEVCSPDWCEILKRRYLSLEQIAEKIKEVERKTL